jgi:NADPH-dependent 2,4-dienoyl-CoA reductase/sulfur reductase-like enzyme
VKYVIIGNGVAGMEAALELRRRDEGAQITVISEESDHFFSRTALMYVVCGQMAHRDIEPLERDVYDRLRLTRVRGRAIGLDTDGRTVTMAGGLPPVPYDQLLICCGSGPRRAPFWDGYDTLRGVGHLVTLQDLDWLHRELHGRAPYDQPERAEAHLAHSAPDSPYAARPTAQETRGRPSQRPAVVGGGLIGIESVEVMLAAGLKPTFFIRDRWFWPIALNEQESSWVAEEMRHHGVDVRTEHDLQRLEGDEHGCLARIHTDRGAVDADLLVVAIGVVPQTGWLADTPIERQERGGGIVVDEALRTNVDGVFAAGDCAAVRWHDGSVRPEQLWYTGRDQGRMAARSMLGDDVRYARGTLYNSAKLMDIEYTTAGLVGWDLDGESDFLFEEKGKVHSMTRFVTQHGRLVGFNALGRRWDHSVICEWIEERRSLPWVLDRLQAAAFDTEFVPPLHIPPTARPTA